MVLHLHVLLGLRFDALPEDLVVPLELPALDSSQDASSTCVADGAPPHEVMTPDEEKRLDAVGWRMLNLPLIVCHSANGMPFFFPLQKVNLMPNPAYCHASLGTAPFGVHKHALAHLSSCVHWAQDMP